VTILRICVVGAGYVGLVTAAVIAGLGHQVSVVDKQPEKLAVLQKGETPIFEEGLPALVKENFREGRLTFTGDLFVAAAEAEVVFIAVGTPAGPDGSPDMTAFHEVRDALCQLPARSLDSDDTWRTPGRLAVIKSTVPIGAGDALQSFFQKKAISRWQVINNPEFLRQGTALYDTTHADRIVIGAEEEDASHLLMKIYTPLGRPVLLVDRCSAEMIKYAANAFLATKISFINEIACLCEQLDADIVAVAHGMGMDARIGSSFLKAGIGFGGSCFPKDLHALLTAGQVLQAPLPLISAVTDVNGRQNLLLIRYLEELYGSLQGLHVCLWGLTYKPGTDDVRDAPSLAVLSELTALGAYVTAYDPQLKACRLARQQFPTLTVARDPYEAAARSEAILLLTEWPEFAHLNWNRLRRLVRKALVLDGRNFLEGSIVEAGGFDYAGVGQKRYSLKRLKVMAVEIQSQKQEVAGKENMISDFRHSTSDLGVAAR
jgi:UDPglucose 6-dehydrogenase